MIEWTYIESIVPGGPPGYEATVGAFHVELRWHAGKLYDYVLVCPKLELEQQLLTGRDSDAAKTQAEIALIARLNGLSDALRTALFEIATRKP